MKKRIITIMVFILLSFTNCSNNRKIEYKSNPELIFVQPDWQGNISVKGRFYNDTLAESPAFWSAFKWKLSANPQRKEKKNERYQLHVHRFDNLFNEDGITWLGHSTFVIQIGGVNIITDPVFYNIPSNKRKTELPCDPDSLKAINYILLSHNHYDHFSKKSIRQIINNNLGVNIFMPLNAAKLLNKKIRINANIQEAGWYQEYKTNENVRIIFLPAKHWGRRGLNDTNKTLWGSFLILSGNIKIFFAGDSAYDEELYKKIHQLFGDIDICILPIGAYSPEWFMSQSHMNPEEAVKAFEDLHGKLFIPMHYGTFDMSDEPMGEPIKRLQNQSLNNLYPVEVKELTIGEKFLINN